MSNHGGYFSVKESFSHLGMSDRAIAKMIQDHDKIPTEEKVPNILTPKQKSVYEDIPKPVNVENHYKMPTVKTIIKKEPLYIPYYQPTSNKYDKKSRHDRLLLWGLDMLPLYFPTKKHMDIKEMLSTIIRREINAYASDSTIKNEIRKVIKFEIENEEKKTNKEIKDGEIQKLETQLAEMKTKLEDMEKSKSKPRSRSKSKSKRKPRSRSRSKSKSKRKPRSRSKRKSKSKK